MTLAFRCAAKLRRSSQTLLFIFLITSATLCHAADPAAIELYTGIKSFQLAGRSIKLGEFAIKRDGVEMLFSGEFYPAQPTNGQTYGAVFIGNGRIHLAPFGEFEKHSIRRFLKANAVDATFKYAVLRFTDGTAASLGSRFGKATDLRKAQELADQLEPRLVRETGLNLSARMAQAIVHAEQPGIFFAELSGGDRKRFGLIIDHQCRSIISMFSLDAGEKGALYQYRESDTGNDVWTAFYDQQDIARRNIAYSDSFDLVRVPNYRIDADLRRAPQRLTLTTEMDIVALRDGVRLLNLDLNEALGEYDNERLKKGARVLSASLADGTPIRFIQGEWDKAVWLELPGILNQRDTATLKLKIEAKDCYFSWKEKFYYPLVNTSWYPRHGSLQPSQFDLTFHHKAHTTAVSSGDLVEGRKKDGDSLVTHWRTTVPLRFITFAVGPFELHQQKVKVGTKEVALDYYSVPHEYFEYSWIASYINEEFMLAEMQNTVTFYSAMFGDYPFERFAAVFSPRPFGQGLPGLLLLPSTGSDHLWDFEFIAHETSHQWWAIRWAGGHTAIFGSARDSLSILHCGISKRERNRVTY